MPKPNKILYDNQDLVKKTILDKIMRYFSNFQEVYLIGSLLNKKFGIYENPWRDHGNQIHMGSDIDILIFDLDKIPNSWRLLISRDYCDIYFVKTINYEGNDHVVEAIVVKNNDISKKIMHESIPNKELIIKK